MQTKWRRNEASIRAEVNFDDNFLNDFLVNSIEILSILPIVRQ